MTCYWPSFYGTVLGVPKPMVPKMYKSGPHGPLCTFSVPWASVPVSLSLSMYLLFTGVFILFPQIYKNKRNKTTNRWTLTCCDVMLIPLFWVAAKCLIL